jgi:hypothetical protein
MTQNPPKCPKPSLWLTGIDIASALEQDDNDSRKGGYT